MTDNQVMVINRNILFGTEYFFEGFAPAERFNFEQRILENFEWIPREQAEKDTSYKQPIAYCLIINPTEKKVFLYKRAQNEKYDEERLRSKISIGIGGHIHKLDTSTNNPIYTSLLREIQEEVKTNTELKNLKVLGYINQDNGQVEQYHLGILYAIETDSDVTPATEEIESGEMKTLEEIESLSNEQGNELENWSKIALEQLKKIFGVDD